MELILISLAITIIVLFIFSIILLRKLHRLRDQNETPDIEPLDVVEEEIPKEKKEDVNIEAEKLRKDILDNIEKIEIPEEDLPAFAKLKMLDVDSQYKWPEKQVDPEGEFEKEKEKEEITLPDPEELKRQFKEQIKNEENGTNES